MYGLSTADGFMSVKEGVDEMIKYLANEPSVGLYFVQQHAQASMPHILNLKDEVVEKIHEVTLHTEDMDDSIDVLKSMPECGLPITDHMIKDINKSLLLMSTSQPKRGLITNRSGGFPLGRSISTSDNSGSSHGYLSSVLSSAKQKAAALRWSQPCPPPSATEIYDLSTAADAEGDELPLSSQLVDDQPVESDAGSQSSHMVESYDKFRLEREAKLEAWLQES